jgi:hypothetical protein
MFFVTFTVVPLYLFIATINSQSADSRTTISIMAEHFSVMRAVDTRFPHKPKHKAYPVPKLHIPYKSVHQHHLHPRKIAPNAIIIAVFLGLIVFVVILGFVFLRQIRNLVRISKLPPLVVGKERFLFAGQSETVLLHLVFPPSCVTRIGC